MPKPGCPSATLVAAATASTLKSPMRARGAPALSASSSSCARWSIANAISVGQWSRRVVDQWMWLRSASWRSAWCLLPYFRKYCSSVQVGISGEHSRRDTANAPQALAQVAQVSSASPVSQPRRKPDMKASPAPSTL